MGAKRRRPRPGCGCDGALDGARVVAVQVDEVDDLDLELRELREIDRLAFYDPDEDDEPCR